MIQIAMVLALSLMALPNEACTEGSIRSFVEHIERIAEPTDLGILMTDPKVAAACLVRQLHTVNPTVLTPEERESHADDFRVIWTVRALRYITGGKDVLASLGSTHLSGKGHSVLTTNSRGEIPFFAVWMSRDIIYIAPKKEQATIIEAWRQWYQTEGLTYNYRKADGFEWYF